MLEINNMYFNLKIVYQKNAVQKVERTADRYQGHHTCSNICHHTTIQFTYDHSENNLKSLWKILFGDPIIFLHILFDILSSSYYENFYRYLMT